MKDNVNNSGAVPPLLPPSSKPLPHTKQELQGRSSGIELDTVNSADDAAPPAGSPVTVGNGAADTSSPVSPSEGEGQKKHPINATENGSSCSGRSTDAPSREGSIVAMDESPAVVGLSTGNKSAVEEPAQEDAVATPRTLRADACLPCSMI